VADLIRHLIPNTMGPILVTVTMLIPSAIFMEAILGFIGLGLPAPMASLGTMCNMRLKRCASPLISVPASAGDLHRDVCI
jgi:ABC-type dipeptide/oligopeptide/nickel transport system permease subunit